MDINQMIGKNLQKTFSTLKSLTEDATFIKKAVSGFDFSTATETSTSTSVSCKVLPLGLSKDRSDKALVKQKILFMSADTGDLSLFDKVSFQGATWSFTSPLRNDGNIILVELIKEA